MLKSIIENNVRLCLVGLKLLGYKIRVNYNLNKLVLNIEFILRFYVQGAAGIHSHFTLYFLSNQNYTKNQFKCMKFLGDVYLYI